MVGDAELPRHAGLGQAIARGANDENQTNGAGDDPDAPTKYRAHENWSWESQPFQLTDQDYRRLITGCLLQTRDER